MQWAPPFYGWGTPNFYYSGVFVEDTLILVNDGTPGIDTVLGYNLSEIGCHPSPEHAYEGKICVIRGNSSCLIDSKAKYAQAAGAVAVIVINDSNNVVFPPSGAQINKVTIPVLVISSSDGAAILTAMATSPVVAYVGNKNGYYANDVGYSSGDVTFSKYTAIPKIAAKNGSEYSFKVKGTVFNFGKNNQSSVVVNAKVTHNGNVVYNQNSTPLAILATKGGDFQLPDFSLADYPVGKYSLTYTASSSNGESYNYDNALTYDFYVSDTLFSYSDLDSSTLLAKKGFSRRGQDLKYSNFTSCINYKDSVASRMAVDGLYFHFQSAAEDSLSNMNQEFIITAYRWENPFTGMNDPAFNPVTSFNSLLNSEIERVTYYYPSASDDSSVYVKFKMPISLEDNRRYLFCVSPSNPKIYLGCSGPNLNYTKNLLEYHQPISPILVADNKATWYVEGFGPSSIPAIQLRVFPSQELSVAEQIYHPISTFPNPATNMVTLSSSEKELTLLMITDVTGKIITQKSSEAINGKLEVNTTNLKSGVYFLTVRLGNGETTQVRVVKE